MNEHAGASRLQLLRQIAHWVLATSRFGRLEDLASQTAWSGLERYLGLSIRRHLSGVADQLRKKAGVLQAALDAASSETELRAVRLQLLAFRRQYLRAETTLDFYVDAINTRTNPTIAGLLKACDSLAYRSMAQALDQLDRPTPVTLTYLDKGLGASILKAGLRLWDGGSESPAAAIKIVWHNLQRPTALIHESGHQFAHIVGWNSELAVALDSGLGRTPAGLAQLWAGCASEIAADAFAFVHTGYGSVAALHDVLAGDAEMVLRYRPGDPHPISYLRVLLGVEMCLQSYGAGPWDDLARAWTEYYPVEGTKAEAMIHASLPLLPKVSEITLSKSMRAFGGRPLTALIDPRRVSPAALDLLERRLGAALYTSMHWVWTEALRLLALGSLRVASRPEDTAAAFRQQEEWMLRLGGATRAA